MAWKKTIVTFVITNLVCCAGLSQESRQTRELRQKIRVESNLVVLTVTVKDDSGRLVSGLLKDDFHVFDDEVEQSILSFTDESLPLSLLILVDDDLKWKEGTQMARSVRSVIGDIADQDEAMVCRFDMLFYPGGEFTSDSMKLMAALKSAQSAAQPSSPKDLHPRSSVARRESFCPLDKDLSWKSRNRKLTHYRKPPQVDTMLSGDYRSK
jgi:VWFA-related protein